MLPGQWKIRVFKAKRVSSFLMLSEHCCYKWAIGGEDILLKELIKVLNRYQHQFSDYF